MSDRKGNSESRALASWQGFQQELETRSDDLANMLPSNVPFDRFRSSAISAIKQNPDLLTCTPRSLFGAITKSAQDGLLPDGREGIITKYREKQKDKSYLTVAQWNPMVYGLRKRARELDDIIIDAQVVHDGDEFYWCQGDEPRIEHKPAPLGDDRGRMVGAYAIFRKDGEILHREVMSKPQIETVKGQSKAKDGLLWTKFESEAWRKTVARRGIKTVPCSEKLEAIARRDDENFDFLDQPADLAPPAPPIDIIPAGPVSSDPALPPTPPDEEPASEPEPKPEEWPDIPDDLRRVKDKVEDAEIVEVEPIADPDAYIDNLSAQLLAAVEVGDESDLRDVIEEAEGNLPALVSPDDKARAQKLIDDHRDLLA